jgi:hypothetical protein
LRDQGWLLKWVGSLLIVTGVFIMFKSAALPETVGGRANYAFGA